MGFIFPLDSLTLFNEMHRLEMVLMHLKRMIPVVRWVLDVRHKIHYFVARKAVRLFSMWHCSCFGKYFQFVWSKFFLPFYFSRRLICNVVFVPTGVVYVCSVFLFFSFSLSFFMVLFGGKTNSCKLFAKWFYAVTMKSELFAIAFEKTKVVNLANLFGKHNKLCWYMFA